jgi:hypothetical protein
MIRRPRILLVSALTLASMAFAATSRAYDPLTWRSLDCGGSAFATAGGYRLGGSIGQPDAGQLASGAFVLRGGFWIGGQSSPVGVDESRPSAHVFHFYPLTPNPARSRYRVAFDLPRASRVALTIFDISGRAVQHREMGLLPAGHQERTGDAVDSNGRTLSSGVYFLRLDADREHGVRRIVMLH